ncbi:MAG: hypothetical protein P8I42_03895, partial [Flavobacteriaceae bacterium]|nr:hypothetical protein [Flavobacteriaceae bacterium]
VFFGCSKDSDANTSEVYIRLSNISEYNFKNIVVNTSTGNVDFENIDSGQMSQYKNFETAYQYAFVELEIEGRIHTIQPIDYVEETPLEDGYYTYQIDANDSQEQYGRISLTIIEDKK